MITKASKVGSSYMTVHPTRDVALIPKYSTCITRRHAHVYCKLSLFYKYNKLKAP